MLHDHRRHFFAINVDIWCVPTPLRPPLNCSLRIIVRDRTGPLRFLSVFIRIVDHYRVCGPRRNRRKDSPVELNIFSPSAKHEIDFHSIAKRTRLHYPYPTLFTCIRTRRFRLCPGPLFYLTCDILAVCVLKTLLQAKQKKFLDKPRIIWFSLFDRIIVCRASTIR